MAEEQEHELKFSVDERIQAKFSLMPDRPGTAVDLLKKTFGWARFQIRPTSVESLRDEYFDTDDLKLYKAGGCLRIRHTGRDQTLGVKILIGVAKGEFTRTERSQPLTATQYDDLVRSRFTGLEMLSGLPDLDGESFALFVVIENQRQYFSVAQDAERYRLALDTFTFVDPVTRAQSPSYFEVELEAETPEASRKLPTIRHQLVSVLEGRMEVARVSKYERGADFVKELRGQTPVRSQSVFLVHGHNTAVVDHAARFLQSGGANVIILREQPDRGETIIEKFESYSRQTDYAVVFLTADDRGGPAAQRTLLPRARQNVILELGFFLGALGRDRVCALREEGVEMPSDYGGIVYVPLDPAGAWKTQLGHRLRGAGVTFDLNKAGLPA